jgi:hypothetical protein
MSEAFDKDPFFAEIKKHMAEERRKERPDYNNVVYCDVHLGVPANPSYQTNSSRG